MIPMGNGVIIKNQTDLETFYYPRILPFWQDWYNLADTLVDAEKICEKSVYSIIIYQNN